MAVRIAQHAPTEGKAVEIFVAVLPKGKRKAPVKQTLTATAATKGATTITVSPALTGEIQKGQYLQFVDADGNESICQLSAKAAIAATALTVVALPEAIPAAAVAEFPPYIWDRKSADLSRDYKMANVSTFNTGGFDDGLLVGGSKKIPLPGIYYFKNAGLKTIKWCSENSREFWLIRALPAPTDDYTVGESLAGPALCTGFKEGAPDDGFISADLDITFLGYIQEIEPVPVV